MWLRAAVGMWGEREVKVVAYRTSAGYSNEGCSRSPSPRGHLHLSFRHSLPLPFHSTVSSSSFIFLHMTHPYRHTPIVFSFLPHCFRSELSPFLSISSHHALLPLLPFLPSAAPHSGPLTFVFFSFTSSILSILPPLLLGRKTISLECLWGDCANGAH